MVVVRRPDAGERERRDQPVVVTRLSVLREFIHDLLVDASTPPRLVHVILRKRHEVRLDVDVEIELVRDLAEQLLPVDEPRWHGQPGPYE